MSSNPAFRCFTQPDILHQIGVTPLQKFVGHFSNSDPQFTTVDPESHYFSSERARLFAQAQVVSPRLRETLALIEAAASPENHQRISDIAQDRLPGLCVSEYHPLGLALELWLTCPEELTQIQRGEPLTPCQLAWYIQTAKISRPMSRCPHWVGTRSTDVPPRLNFVSKNGDAVERGPTGSMD